MKKELGKTITVVNAIVFAVIILVGAVSLYLTQNILHNGYKIKETSEHIPKVDKIYADAYRLVLALHHFLIDPDELYSREVISKISEIETETKKYKAQEIKETYRESKKEIKLLDAILEDIDGLKYNLPAVFEEFARTGKFDKERIEELEEFAYHIEATVKEINSIHFVKITEWEEESIVNMWIILIIYLVFITFGGAFVYVGHRLLSVKVVKPIKELSSATIEFSDGTFDRRVHTDSKTEIGVLYQSFNKMADKLQEHDKFLREFNVELEKKVKERTLELLQANEQLRKTQNTLVRTEKIAAVGQVAAIVAHEIKNPLNSLSINTQMLSKELLEKFGPDSSAHESATHIGYEVKRINNILDEFVKFTRFPEPLFIQNNINQVITEVADLLLENAKESNVMIKLSLQEDIPEFKFDARQFKMVFMNLAQNAIGAIDKGGLIEIETRLQNRDVLIIASDTGRGIPDKDIEKIFTLFFTTKERGLGLGLSIVQKIVESHGGRINCTSKVGEGTVFEIVLPIERG